MALANVMLSLKSGYNPQEHIRVGQALQPLRDEDVLIICSGLTYHNMKGFGREESTPIAEAFENYLNNAIEQGDATVRNDMLAKWEAEPGARLPHPREDHLIPLMVVADAAGNDKGRPVFVDRVMKVPMAKGIMFSTWINCAEEGRKELRLKLGQGQRCRRCVARAGCRAASNYIRHLSRPK